MALLLREADVAALLTIDDVITAVEAGFKSLGEGRAVNRPRSRAITPSGTLQVLHAIVPDLGVMGVKTYATTPRGARFIAILYRMEDGDVLVVAEADTLGQIRTGAASGVATRYLARPDAGVLGIIGAGWQARSQVQAIARTRPVALVKVYSRSAERREAFAEEMVADLGTEVVAVDRAEDALADADIVVTATNSRQPVLQGAWLRPGMHINAIGSNAAGRQEIDVAAVRRADRIVVDMLEQARIEAGDLIAAESAGEPVWERVTELGAIVAGSAPGRTDPASITLFESQGIAMEDVVTLELLYRRATAAGAGVEIPLSRAAVNAR
ncbi:MAG: ornithine cyclodeaminase family protein [Armatimonadota bacterium]|nr:ornithine cyclodeaminase family protein [Armatimonadota bacterium]